MKTAQPTPSPHDAARATTVGIDLCAAYLDLQAGPVGTLLRFADDAPGRLGLRSCVRRLGPTRAALEPSGRHHDPLHQRLAAAGTVAAPARADERIFQRRTARPAYDR